ncbi:MAG: hypothetical protein ABIQ55_07445 [Gemmatimonadaceae bacterium]
MRSYFARIASAIAIASSLACASAGGPSTNQPGRNRNGADTTSAQVLWPVRTQFHVDLWLHGFAMIQDDTTTVPFFRRGYKADMTDLKRRANVSTLIDSNREKLRARLAVNPQLVNAQFVPLYFNNFDELAQAADLLYRADGNPRAANSQQAAEMIQILTGYFPTQSDRDWLRLFVQSVRDEDARFYRNYWNQQQGERGDVVTQVNNLWQNTYRPRLQAFLNNTSQRSGEIILSMPLGGEGRTLSTGKTQNSSVVTYPTRLADAIEAIYVVAHELSGNIVSIAVRDNVTPTDQRNGLADRYIAAGSVRAGAILLQKVSPDLVDGYARYYLRSANKPIGSNATASLALAFPLPDGIRNAITRQIEVVLGGI